MSGQGRRSVVAAKKVPVVLLLSAIAACSHQSSYSPPEHTLQCPHRMICAGDGGRLKQSGESCRCARLVDYTG